MNIFRHFSRSQGGRRGDEQMFDYAKSNVIAFFSSSSFPISDGTCHHLQPSSKNNKNKSVKKLSSSLSFLFSTFFTLLLKVNYEIEVYN